MIACRVKVSAEQINHSCKLCNSQIRDTEDMRYVLHASESEHERKRKKMEVANEDEREARVMD